MRGSPLANRGGQRMQGVIETLLAGILMRGLRPAFLSVLMAAPMKKVARAQLKKIYVLGDRGEMAGEYVLDPDCPIDYNDFLKILPEEGIGDRESVFVGEYVFTAFQAGKVVFVILSRGQLTKEDFDWTALLLTAADSHLAPTSPSRPSTPRPAESPSGSDKERNERENRLVAREKSLAELEARLKADSANLAGRQEELQRQKDRLAALADYSTELQESVTNGVARAVNALAKTESLAAAKRAEPAKPDPKAALEARQQFDQERKALIAEKTDLEARYKDAATRIAQLEKETRDAVETLELERSNAAARTAEDDRVRREIETRVADLSQRFASMAKERLVNSHRPPGEASDDVKKALEGEKAELAREKKFLQRRAIELLDREERVRDRGVKLDDREHNLARRDEDLAARERDIERSKTLLAQLRPPTGGVAVEGDEAKKDIERRVKIIQQKALELLDREEKLRKRAADLQALEARLTGRVAAQ